MSRLLINGISELDAPELILFDKDGTLIDIHHYWASMIRIRAALISQHCSIKPERQQQVEAALIDVMGVDENTSKMKPEGPVGVKPRPVIVQVAAQVVRAHGGELSDDEVEMLFKQVDSQTADNMQPLLRLLPGVKHLLEQLKTCGISAAVVSTDLTERAHKAMEVLGIEHYFSNIVGADAVRNTKPAPDLADLMIEQMSCSKERTAVIGDHPVDIKMGIAAGIATNIGVLTGLSDRSAFKDLNCVVAADLTMIEARC